MWTESPRLTYERGGLRYATDLTAGERALIVPPLPAPRRLGRLRTTALREVVNAVLYLLRTGCPWRIGGMDRQSLRDWVHRFNAEGPGGLIDRKTPFKDVVEHLTPRSRSR